MLKLMILFLSLASIQLASAADVNCTVDGVAVIGNRVHVHCAALSPISYFALPLDAPAANAFLSMGQQVLTENIRAGQVFEMNSFCAPMITHGEITGTIGCRGRAQGQTGTVTASGGTSLSMFIEFDDKDTSGKTFGCNPKDCRKPLSFSMSR